MSAAALFFRLRLPDFSGPSGFYGRVARRGFGRGLAAAFFSGQPARFSFSARSLFRACSLSLFARSRVTGAGRFRRVSESADGAVPAAPADFFRAVGFLRTGCPTGLRWWAGCRPFTRPRMLFSRVGRLHRRPGCACPVWVVRLHRRRGARFGAVGRVGNGRCFGCGYPGRTRAGVTGASSFRRKGCRGKRAGGPCPPVGYTPRQRLPPRARRGCKGCSS